MVLSHSTKILITLLLIGCSPRNNSLYRIGLLDPSNLPVPTENLNGRVEFNAIPVNDTLARGDSLRLELSYRNLSEDSLFVFIISNAIYLEHSSAWEENRNKLDTFPDGLVYKSSFSLYRVLPYVYKSISPQKVEDKRPHFEYKKFGAFDSIKTTIVMEFGADGYGQMEYRVKHAMNEFAMYYDTTKYSAPKLPIGVETLYSKPFSLYVLEQ